MSVLEVGPGDRFAANLRDLEILLAHTDEKRVFADKLGALVAASGAASILDIGAGNGDLALPLSSMVGRYVAIEKDPACVAALKARGLDVIEGSFPVPVGGQFDVVLLSYVLADVSNSPSQVLRSAWNLVEPGGHLVVLTGTGSGDAWADVLQVAGSRFARRHESAPASALATLRNLGDCRLSEFESHITAATQAELIDVLTAMGRLNGVNYFAARQIEGNAELKRLLQTYRKADGAYRLPMTHRLLDVHKTLPGVDDERCRSRTVPVSTSRSWQPSGGLRE